jgi:hypothetical protein
MYGYAFINSVTYPNLGATLEQIRKRIAPKMIITSNFGEV